MPLEMSDRVSLPPAEIPGESVLAELTGPQALLVFDVLRAVLLVVQKNRLALLYNTFSLDAWEAQLLESEYPEELRFPLGVLIGSIRDRDDARPLMAKACLLLPTGLLNSALPGLLCSALRPQLCAFPKTDDTPSLPAGHTATPADLLMLSGGLNARPV